MNSDKIQFAEYIAIVVSESLDWQKSNSDVTGICDLGHLDVHSIEENVITFHFQTTMEDDRDEDVATTIKVQVTEVEQRRMRSFF